MRAVSRSDRSHEDLGGISTAISVEKLLADARRGLLRLAPGEAHDAAGSGAVIVDGYSSSLAAATLRLLGRDATDVIGGFQNWLACGLPVVR